MEQKKFLACEPEISVDLSAPPEFSGGVTEKYPFLGAVLTRSILCFSREKTIYQNMFSVTVLHSFFCCIKYCSYKSEIVPALAPLKEQVEVFFDSRFIR